MFCSLFILTDMSTLSRVVATLTALDGRITVCTPCRFGARLPHVRSSGLKHPVFAKHAVVPQEGEFREVGTQALSHGLCVPRV